MEESYSIYRPSFSYAEGDAFCCAVPRIRCVDADRWRASESTTKPPPAFITNSSIRREIAHSKSHRYPYPMGRVSKLDFGRDEEDSNSNDTNALDKTVPTPPFEALSLSMLQSKLSFKSRSGKGV